jgi:hypothetical protein
MQVLADFAAERASVVSAATAQVNAAGSEVEALRRLLRLKGRELQQLRHLAQEVLLQRSEVEIFLLSSLHQVRDISPTTPSGFPTPCYTLFQICLSHPVSLHQVRGITLVAYCYRPS